MDFDIYTRTALLVAGMLLILVVNIDMTYVLSKLIFWKKSSQKSEKDFLIIINLWYQLKNMCDKNEYLEASSKLNEVFPLLNINKAQNDE